MVCTSGEIEAHCLVKSQKPKFVLQPHLHKIFDMRLCFLFKKKHNVLNINIKLYQPSQTAVSALHINVFSWGRTK